MVGVPGKYKGCNTCRARRVKCDNTRPFCKKCTDYGRDCGGYERETVFIVGTPDQEGRCASHPPRNLQGSKRNQTDEDDEPILPNARLELVAAEPLRPAWDEALPLTSGNEQYWARYVAHQTRLGSVLGNNKGGLQRNETTLSLSEPQLVNVAPAFGADNFRLASSCLVHLPSSRNDQAAGSSSEPLLLFLYEQNSSAAYSNEPLWKDKAALADVIRESGPGAYQTFPAHHFFARVYRPSALWAALLNRQPTFLCSPEWTIVPWEIHPRTPLDDLLDIVVLLPSIFSRLDRVTPIQPSRDRSLKARDLLGNCLNIERQFDIWYEVTRQSARDSSNTGPLYWMTEARPNATQLPFPETFAFTTPLLCLVHVYYWAVLVSFHQCIYALLKITSQPEEEGSSGPSMTPGMFEGSDTRKYHPAETRKLAANVCRSLDYALNTTTQPDLLVAPLWVVTNFYNGVRRFGDGELEQLWCAGVHGRLETRKQQTAAWLEAKGWTELQRFG